MVTETPKVVPKAPEMTPEATKMTSKVELDTEWQNVSFAIPSRMSREAPKLEPKSTKMEQLRHKN